MIAPDHRVERTEYGSGTEIVHPLLKVSRISYPRRFGRTPGLPILSLLSYKCLLRFASCSLLGSCVTEICETQGPDG